MKLSSSGKEKQNKYSEDNNPAIANEVLSIEESKEKEKEKAKSKSSKKFPKQNIDSSTEVVRIMLTESGTSIELPDEDIPAMMKKNDDDDENNVKKRIERGENSIPLNNIEIDDNGNDIEEEEEEEKFSTTLGIIPSPTPGFDYKKSSTSQTISVILKHYVLLIITPFVMIFVALLWIAWNSLLGKQQFFDRDEEDWSKWFVVTETIDSCLVNLLLFFYPMVILYYVYDIKCRRFIITNIVSVGAVLAWTVVRGILGWHSIFAMLPVYAIFLEIVIYNGWEFGHTFNNKKLTYIFTFSVIPISIFMMLNDLTIIPFYVGDGITDDHKRDLRRLYTRVLIHPMTFAVLLFIIRFAGRRYPESKKGISQSFITILPLYLASFFGRFFTSNLHSYWAILVASFAVSFGEIFVLFAQFNKHKLRPYIEPWIPDWFPKMIKNFFYYDFDGDRYYASYLVIESLIENTALVLAIATNIAYELFIPHEIIVGDDSRAAFLAKMISILAIQYGVGFLEDFISTYLQLRHKLPVTDFWEHIRYYYPLLAYSVLTGASFTTWRSFQVLTGKWK